MRKATSFKSGARLQKEGPEGAFGAEMRLQQGEPASGEVGGGKQPRQRARVRTSQI